MSDVYSAAEVPADLTAPVAHDDTSAAPVAHDAAAAAAVATDDRIAELEAIVNRWAPVLEGLYQVEQEAQHAGHSVGSIVREVGARLLGILAR